MAEGGRKGGRVVSKGDSGMGSAKATHLERNGLARDSLAQRWDFVHEFTHFAIMLLAADLHKADRDAVSVRRLGPLEADERATVADVPGSPSRRRDTG